MAPVRSALDGFADVEVWAEVRARQGAVMEGPAKTVKQAEFEVLAGTKESAGADLPDGNFYARSLPAEAWAGHDRPWMTAVERVVLVHRLREVVAQVGFTRFEASSPDVEGELQMGVQAAPLARETTWLPAVENRGEGVFVQFRKSVIDDWVRSPAVVDRGKRLLAGFDAWGAAHPHSTRKVPGAPVLPAPYRVSPVADRRIPGVRLPSQFDPGTGVCPEFRVRDPVVHGLAGRRGHTRRPRRSRRQIAATFAQALELARLCSNDPVCAQHDPPGPHEARFLLGAACHGCLLVAETSCEQHNDFLDRADRTDGRRQWCRVLSRLTHE